ncbi:transposase domain-containing protein [Profundibacter sp.]
MLIPVKTLCGLGGIPKDRTASKKWFAGEGISLLIDTQDGRNPVFVNLSDLPPDVRRAYNEQRISQMGFSMGQYDEIAHEEFFASPPSLQETAQRKAEIAEALLAMEEGSNWADRIKTIRAKFGKRGTSKPSLMRILQQVKGVDPINFAPALLPKYQGRKTIAKTTEEAWALFLTIIRDAAQDFPIIQAWRDVRDISVKQDWDWPPYQTVLRRWKKLPVEQRYVARYGKGETGKLLSQPALRDKTSIRALDWVSLDGRTLDFWVETENGGKVRLTMIALVDIASNMVLDYELAVSENASSTLRLIKRTCATYGIFDRIYTDNGSAFAGYMVSGGNPHRFRNKRTMSEGVRPMGICWHLGIKMHFALPANGQAKIAERTFATLSRVIDDRPEFNKAHAGHSPGASPNKNVKPVPLSIAEEVIRSEVNRHNEEEGRRSQGANGRSYKAVFEAGLKQRVTRKPTQRQLYLAGLIYRKVAVNRHGQVIIDKWTYGSPYTQSELLPFHGKGQRIIFGRDPDDLTAPAIAFDKDNRLICEGIEYVSRGAYDSKDGIRDAARNRKAAKDAVKKAEEANNYLSDSELAAALAILREQQIEHDSPCNKVVGGHFSSPLRGSKPDQSETVIIPDEYLRNLDNALAKKRLQGVKPA